MLKVFSYPLAIGQAWEVVILEDLNWVMVSIIIIFYLLIIDASLLHHPLTHSLCIGHKQAVEHLGFCHNHPFFLVKQNKKSVLLKSNRSSPTESPKCEGFFVESGRKRCNQVKQNVVGDDGEEDWSSLQKQVRWQVVLINENDDRR